jgi:hypothetical protein
LFDGRRSGLRLDGCCRTGWTGLGVVEDFKTIRCWRTRGRGRAALGELLLGGSVLASDEALVPSSVDESESVGVDAWNRRQWQRDIEVLKTMTYIDHG